MARNQECPNTKLADTLDAAPQGLGSFAPPPEGAEAEQNPILADLTSLGERQRRDDSSHPRRVAESSRHVSIEVPVGTGRESARARRVIELH